MRRMRDGFAIACACLAVFGIAQAVLGCRAVRRFAARPAPAPASFPPVTVLKPLHGAEPLLEPALLSFCTQDYPEFQIVAGVQDPADPALAVLDALRRRCPEARIDVMVDPTPHGANRKIANLINMMRAARHDLLVISDGDIHAAPDYLRRVVSALQQPGTGLVTTPYAGRPASASLAARLGASHVTHSFLPGVLLAVMAGRQDCLGATMALHRDVLARIGGFAALANHLADDAVLGQRVRQAGLGIALAATVPETTVAESTMGALLQHELRWARTIRALVPVSFAFSSLQYPAFWALLAVLASAGSGWSLAVLLAAWLARAGAARGIDRALGLARNVPFWLFPLRDLLSAGLVLASYAGSRVVWRGQVLHAAAPPAE